MSLTSWNHLRDVFLEDHRHLTGGLAQIREALSEGDNGKAAQLAEQLDQTVGPHILFEEQHVYPELRDKLGDDFVDRLYEEHYLGQQAIRRLSRLHDGGLGEQERTELMSMLDVACKHAMSCGTLISHLARLDESRQEQLLAELTKSRRKPVQWTELPPASSR